MSSLFYPTSSSYLTIFVNFYVCFTLFIVLLYFIISQRFSFYTSTNFLWHAVSHSYNVMVSFAFFVFVRHTAHCFLLLVSCMLYVVKKHCPEEAHLNRWAKHRLIIKITKRSNLSAWFETWWQTLRNNNMSSKKNSIFGSVYFATKCKNSTGTIFQFELHTPLFTYDVEF